MSNRTNIMAMLQTAKSEQIQYADLLKAQNRFINHLRKQPFPTAIDRFALDPTGNIEIAFLGLVASASPRLVRLYGPGNELVIAWKFVIEADTRPSPIWGFFLTKDGVLLDQETGAFAGAPIVRIGEYEGPDLPEMIIANVYRGFISSDFLQP
jgi:hypothetical protein